MLNIKTIVKCEPDNGGRIYQLRALVCNLARENHDADYNPLLATQFNEWLDEIVQAAFDKGREYERQKAI